MTCRTTLLSITCVKSKKKSKVFIFDHESHTKSTVEEPSQSLPVILNLFSPLIYPPFPIIASFFAPSYPFSLFSAHIQTSLTFSTHVSQVIWSYQHLFMSPLKSFSFSSRRLTATWHDTRRKCVINVKLALFLKVGIHAPKLLPFFISSTFAHFFLKTLSTKVKNAKAWVTLKRSLLSSFLSVRIW